MATLPLAVRRRFDVLVAGAVFGLAALYLWWLAGHRLILINDEGIYLDGARRILNGSFPYRDFFVLTGPGSFWNVALIFQVFGISLPAARLLPVVDFALIAACLYWLTAQLHTRSAGGWLAGFYIFLLSGDAGGLVVNHRADSGALSVLGVTLFFHGVRSGARWPLVAAGASAGYAAWITPTLLLLLLPLLGWAFYERGKKGAVLFCAGVGVVTAAAVAVLASSDSLTPMVHHFQWTASQYAGANRFPYGGIIGGYPALFADARGMELLLRGYIVLFLMMPALAPVAAGMVLAAVRPMRNVRMLFLGLCALAAVLACAPRLDAAHLVYAAPLSYVVATAGLGKLLSARVGAWLSVFLSVGACLMAGNAISQRLQFETAETRVGRLVGEPRDLELVQELEAEVRPGERFFAFPYIPLAYFLTGGENPTRYSFLQPGMMSALDEESALLDLQEEIPEIILYMDVPPSAYLRLFPSSDPERLRMHRIEEWLASHYSRIEQFSLEHPGYHLLVLR